MTPPTVIETLYYFLQNSVLLGEKQKAKAYLGLLRHEFVIEPKSFVLLDDEKMLNLQKYGDIVDSDLFITNIDFKENINEYEFKRDEEKVKKENELRKMVLKQDIKSLIQADDTFRYTEIEAKTKYGRVDILGRDKDTLFVFELKKEHARHDLIGQIHKYVICYKLKLIRKMYKKVQGVVIANSFDNFTLNELKHNGHTCLKYSLDNDHLNFTKL